MTFFNCLFLLAIFSHNEPTRLVQGTGRAEKATRMKLFACLLVVLASACSPLYGDGPTTPNRETTSSSGSESSDTSSPAYQAGRREAELRAQLAASARERQAAIEAARRLEQQLRQSRTAAPQAQPGPAAAAPLPTAPMAVAGGMPGFPGMGMMGSGPGSQIPVPVPLHGVAGNVGWVDVVTPARAVGGTTSIIAVTRIRPAYATAFYINGRLICPTQDGQTFPRIMTEAGQQICVLPPSHGADYSPTVRFEMLREGSYRVDMVTYSVNSYTGQGTLVGRHSTTLNTVSAWNSSAAVMDMEFH